MDFPVSIPWETLDPEILQKAINSGSNYRTYCDENSWLSTDAAKAELLCKRQMNERKFPNIQKKNRQKW